MFKDLSSYYTQNKITTLEEDDVEKCPLQLYKHIMKQVSITDKKVLKVGSDRGGGVALLQRHPNPQSIAGLDMSENLPFDDNRYDIILNV